MLRARRVSPPSDRVSHKQEELELTMNSNGSSRAAVNISAVLPVYNEEAVIADAVCHLGHVLSELTSTYEIVVTDDGSRDGTARVLARLQASQPELNLRIVSHDRNLGYGAALASGFDASRMDFIFFTDGDKQFDVKELAGFLPSLDDTVDLVIGYRAKRADPPLRLLNAWGWKLLVNSLFGYTARDIDCAFKLFRRSVWQELSVRSRGATFSAELLIKARRHGFRIVELPVSHYPRKAGQATGARPRVILRALRDLFRLRLSLQHELAHASGPARPMVTVKHVGL
jgi:glycosyltransferase involved in cell wall biosynthesis